MAEIMSSERLFQVIGAVDAMNEDLFDFGTSSGVNCGVLREGIYIYTKSPVSASIFSGDHVVESVDMF